MGCHHRDRSVDRREVGPNIGPRAMNLKGQAAGLGRAVTDRKVQNIGSPGSGIRTKLISEGTVDLKV